ncbi:MAG: hypothetical protein OWR52_11055 [Acidibacillus sp.]|uniref:Uncharacterized protein n=1 Tax=Sulfoacidibacillus ferrooxidans TaxID=2005001 RepID=A0A9X2ABQ2_9BACL|nr:hypothetical protein [Sulfoacidibacillus ferrooxidans]MCI0183293.1 hypothetical protein [Sulfoacidibacillus ferrooxidans]MCY0894028.1 hypothetical protein [Acidibacillus sp.]
MIIDLTVFSLIAWSGLLGYIAGWRRLLIYVSVVGGSAYLLTVIIPWLQFVTSDAIIQTEYLHWLNRMLEPVVPVFRFHGVNKGVTNVFASAHIIPTLREWYRQLLLLGTVIVALLGLLIGVRAIDSIWSNELSKEQMTLLGGVFGVVTGVYIAIVVFNNVSVLAFSHSQMDMNIWFYHSLFVHAWTHIRLHGIVS